MGSACSGETCCSKRPTSILPINDMLPSDEPQAMPNWLNQIDHPRAYWSLDVEEVGKPSCDIDPRSLTPFQKFTEERMHQDIKRCGEITRESTGSNLCMDDIDPKKDTYVNEISGERYTADYKNSALHEDHIRLISSRIVPGLAIVNLNYASCKDVSDEFLVNLASLFGTPGAGFRALSLCFRSCSKISDKGVSGFADHLPSTLKVLELDFRFCTKISSDGLASISQHLPAGLRRLALKFRCASNMGDAGLVALARGLPRNLESFEFGCCKCAQVGTRGILALVSNLSSRLNSLCVGLECCFSVHDHCLAGFAQLLPSDLQVLSINCWQCAQVNDPGLAALAQHLPTSLRHLSLCCRSCKGITNSGATALAKGLPITLETLHVDLSQCHQLGDSAMMAFAIHLPQTVQVLDLNFQNTSVSSDERSFYRSPHTLRLLRTQAAFVHVVEAAQPASPPDLQKFDVSPPAS